MSTRRATMKNTLNENRGPLRSIFVCGFIDKRWHNNSLYSIVADLIPTNYVCCNIGNASQWSILRTKQMLSNAEVFLFFVNEFTLGDAHCLLTLQYAWDDMIPIFMLRPPRTKLIVCETEPGYKIPASYATQPTSNLNPNELSDYQPDYPLLQYILYQGYKMSIPYDRLNHRHSMNKIRARLAKIMQPMDLLDPSRSSAGITLSCSDDSARTNSSRELSSASIKSIKSQQNPPKIDHGRNASEGLRLSRSMNNIATTSTQKMNSNAAREDYKRNGSRRRRRLKQTSPSSHHQLNQEITVIHSSEESDTASLPIPRRSSLSEVSNFHSTQYLVFPVKDKSQAPILIHFPQDVIENDTKIRDSTWGSDTSLEEDVEIAPQISGDIHLFNEDEEEDGILADGMHAPYNSDL